MVIGNKQEMEKEFLFIFGVPYIGKPSHMFSKKVQALANNNFNVDMNIYFESFKIGKLLSAKTFYTYGAFVIVMYKFSCLCDTAISYR